MANQDFSTFILEAVARIEVNLDELEERGPIFTADDRKNIDAVRGVCLGLREILPRIRFFKKISLSKDVDLIVVEKKKGVESNGFNGN